MDYTQKMMADYLKQRKKRGGGKDKSKFPWTAGRNNLRLLPFTHKVNDWDLRRGGRCKLPFTEDDLGKEVKLLFVPLVRYFKRGQGGWVMNGLGTRDCPMFQAFLKDLDLDRKQRKAARPDDFFVANAMCMDKPELGVLQVVFKTSEWLGPRKKDKSKAGYGIWDIIAGFTPGETNAPVEEEEGEEVLGGGGGATALGPLPARGNEVIGFKGAASDAKNGARDIVVIKVMGNVAGNDCLLLDHEIENGCLRVRHPSKCADISESRYGQGQRDGVKDLLLIPDFFPGWASNGEHLSEDAEDFTNAFGDEKNQKRGPSKVADDEEDETLGGVSPQEDTEPEDEGPQESPQEEPEDEVVSEEVGEDESPAEEQQDSETPVSEPEPEKKKRRVKKVGSRVTFKQGGTEYIGTILMLGKGDVKSKVKLEAEEQPTDAAKADVRGLAEQGHDCALVPTRSLKLI